MSSRVFLLALAAVAAAVVMAILWNSIPAGRPQEAVSASPREATPTHAARSEGSLLPVAREPSPTLVAEPAPTSTPRTTSQATIQPASPEAVAKWLQRLVPDRYGNLSAGEIASLTEIDLRGADAGDEDLAMLASLTNLRILGLRGTKVTDAGLVHLGGLALASLDLRGTAVTAFGMTQLPTRSLEALHLTDTKVAGADLFRLPPMPRLAVLKLNSLQIDDAALEALSIYPSLRHVELDQTSITAAGLKRLLALNPGLTRIELRSTAVTPEALAELVGTYPGCEFVHENPALPDAPHSGTSGG